MKKYFSRIGHFTKNMLLFILLIFFVSTLPFLFSYGRPSNTQYYSNIDDPDFIQKKLYRLHFHPENLWRKPLLYLRQIKSGRVFTYEEGKTVRNYLTQASRYFKVSFFYVCISGLISLTAGLAISLNMSDRKRNPVFYEFLSFMTVFPDFILIMVIQFLFFYINKISGTQFIRLYTFSASDRAIFLPLVLLSIYPCLYIVRAIGNQLKDLNNETFISMAHAKGLSRRYIKYFHLGPAAVHFIRGDIHKLLSILLANLFITELMFNNKGLTSFLFNNISQYNATVNSVVLILLLYLAVYLCLQLFLAVTGLVLRRSRP